MAPRCVIGHRRRRLLVARPRIVMLAPDKTAYLDYPTVRRAVLQNWVGNPRQLATMGGKLYDYAYTHGVIQNTARNQLILNTAWHHLRRYGDRVLVLLARRSHADLLYRWFTARRSDIAVFQLDGEDPGPTREATLQQFRTSSPAILFATPFFREGQDVPEIDVGILAGGGKSETDVLQGIGRMLRRRPDKEEVLIYDFTDGLDPDEPKDYLARHTRERLDTYARQGFAVECPAWP